MTFPSQEISTKINVQPIWNNIHWLHNVTKRFRVAPQRTAVLLGRPPRPSSSAIREACQEVVKVAERPCACSPCRRRARSSVKVSTWTEAAPTETGRFCKCDRADAVDGKTCARSDLLSLVPVHRSVHSSESQQEFFRMLDEKIEKVRNDKPPHTNKRKRLRLDGGTVDNPFIAANLCMWGHKGLNLCDA